MKRQKCGFTQSRSIGSKDRKNVLTQRRPRLVGRRSGILEKARRECSRKAEEAESCSLALIPQFRRNTPRESEELMTLVKYLFA